MLAATSQVWAQRTPLLDRLREELAWERQQQEMAREFAAKWKAMTLQEKAHDLAADVESEWKRNAEMDANTLDYHRKDALEKCENELYLASLNQRAARPRLGILSLFAPSEKETLQKLKQQQAQCKDAPQVRRLQAEYETEVPRRMCEYMTHEVAVGGPRPPDRPLKDPRLYIKELTRIKDKYCGMVPQGQATP